MEHNMILSASGWRKVFVESGNETDKSFNIGKKNTILSALAAETFSEYIKKKTEKKEPVIVCGRDTRPTGEHICSTIIKILTSDGIRVQYTGAAAAPEIMAYSRQTDGFIYISASHNPIGHNGIKFGLNDGGVLDRTANDELVNAFEKKCKNQNAAERISLKLACAPADTVEKIYEAVPVVKKTALKVYSTLLESVIAATDDPEQIRKLSDLLKENIKQSDIGIAVDMNGSARTVSIDRHFFTKYGLKFYPINDIPGKIEHEIIPEPENLVWCAAHIDQLQKQGFKDAVLGYMPDCDGDRGNVVYWDRSIGRAKILNAQEVFALSVLSVLCYGAWLHHDDSDYKPAVAANGPTSMRIEEIASEFNAPVFRSEVSEANVVNLAREKRKAGYNIRILGEGSNGGTIVHPEAVRDPINTIFLLVQLLTIRDTIDKNGLQEKGLFHIWCEKSGQLQKYKTDFSLSDIIDSLPAFTTTGVSEPRAVLHIKTSDQGKLKTAFQKIFEEQWLKKQKSLKKQYGICSYRVYAMKGTKIFSDIEDFGTSENGGLKIIFYNSDKIPSAFLWMRGSGTEPVFRILCDVKGDNRTEEENLLKWESKMIEEADK